MKIAAAGGALAPPPSRYAGPRGQGRAAQRLMPLRKAQHCQVDVLAGHACWLPPQAALSRDACAATGAGARDACLGRLG